MRRWWIAVALAVALVLAIATAAAVRKPPPPRTIEQVRIALSATPHAALLHLAAAKGYFDEEGLQVSLTSVSHGKAAVDLLVQGKVDLAAAAEVPFVVAVLQGQTLDIVATVARVSTEMAIVARRDKGVVRPGNLHGKKVGVTFGTSGEYFLWSFLIRHRLPPDAVTMVDVPPGQIAGQLARGAIDAAAAWQPLRFGAESALGAEAVSFTAPDAYTVTHVVIGRHDYLVANASIAEKLVRALLKAEAFSRTQRAQALQVLAERLKTDPGTLEPAWRDLDLGVDLRQSHLVTLEDEARWAMARQHAPPGPMPNFLPRLYLDGLLAVQPDRVTVVH